MWMIGEAGGEEVELKGREIANKIYLGGCS